MDITFRAVKYFILMACSLVRSFQWLRLKSMKIGESVILGIMLVKHSNNYKMKTCFNIKSIVIIKTTINMFMSAMHLFSELHAILQWMCKCRISLHIRVVSKHLHQCARNITLGLIGCLTLTATIYKTVSRKLIVA